MEALITASVSFWVDLDQVEVYNLLTGETTKDLSVTEKLNVLRGESSNGVLKSFSDLISNTDIDDYSIFDIEVDEDVEL
jgi:hypothetical protein